MHEMGHLQYKHFQQRVAARLLIPAALEIPFYIIKRNLYSAIKLESAHLIFLTEFACAGFQSAIGDILFYALCRQQERQADAFALNAVEKAEGDILLYRFLIHNAAKENEKLSTREKITKKIMEPLDAIFSTHPSNEERFSYAIKKQREFMILKTLPFLSLRKDRFRYSQLALNRHRILVKNRLLALRSTK